MPASRWFQRSRSKGWSLSRKAPSAQPWVRNRPYLVVFYRGRIQGLLSYADQTSFPQCWSLQVFFILTHDRNCRRTLILRIATWSLCHSIIALPPFFPCLSVILAPSHHLPPHASFQNSASKLTDAKDTLRRTPSFPAVRTARAPAVAAYSAAESWFRAGVAWFDAVSLFCLAILRPCYFFSTGASILLCLLNFRDFGSPVFAFTQPPLLSWSNLAPLGQPPPPL